LAGGDNFADAFSAGLRRMRLAHHGNTVPCLHVRTGVDATRLYIEPLAREHTPPDGLIDFYSERSRHEYFFGRRDVLDELDARLRACTSGWVLLTGGPGLGKSALLHHWLSLREKSGLPTAFHFIRRGHQNWASPGAVRANLAAQVELQFPSVRQLGDGAPARLERALQRVSPLLRERGQQLVLVVDGFDESLIPGSDDNPAPGIFPLELPNHVVAVVASRPVFPALNWFLRRSGPSHRIDLGERSESNDRVVRDFWIALGPSMAPPLTPELEHVAIARAQGNLLHAVKLRELWNKPGCARSADDVPVGFEGMLDELWERIGALVGTARDRARQGLALLCAARESLPLHVLEDLLEWPEGDGEHEFLPATRELLLEELYNGQPAYRPFHDGLREHVKTKLRKTVSESHLKLAEFGAWPLAGDEFRRRYALRHRVLHLIQGGALAQANAICKDVEYLTAKACEFGIAAVEFDLRIAAQVQSMTTKQELTKLGRVIAACSHWAARVPKALPTLLHDRILTNAPSLRDVLRWPDARRPEFPRLRHPLQARGLPRVLEGHAEEISELATLPDGRLVSASRDGMLRVWDLESHTAISTLSGHEGPVRAVAWSSVGGLVSGGDDGTLCVWDIDTGETLAVLCGHAGRITGLAALADGRVISTSVDGTAIVWQVDSSRVLHQLAGHFTAVTAVVSMPPNRVVTASINGELRVWDVDTGELLAVLDGHTHMVNSLVLLPDGRLVSGSSDATLRVWDVDSTAPPVVLNGHLDIVRDIAVLSDGRVASASEDATIRVWNTTSGECELLLTGHLDTVRVVAALSDDRLVSGSADNTLRIWDSCSGRLLSTLVGHQHPVRAIALLVDGRLASGSSDCTVRIWGIDFAEPLAGSAGHEHTVNALAALPDGRVISGSADNTLRVWDSQTGSVLSTLVGHQGHVIAVAVLPRGELVSVSLDDTLRVWDPESGRTLAQLEVRQRHLKVVGVLPNDRVVSASSVGDQALRVWDIDTGEVRAALEHYPHLITSLAVLPDGRLVLGSYDKTLRIWDVESNAALAELCGFESPITAIAVLPDGRIVAADQDRSLCIWQLEADEAPIVLESPRASISAMAALPNGLIVAACGDHTLRLWDIETRRLVAAVFGDAMFTSVVGVSDALIAAGDRAGNVWFVELEITGMLCDRLPMRRPAHVASGLRPRQTWFVWLLGNWKATLLKFWRETLTPPSGSRQP
jgi:WD40 repeat protein